MLKEAEDILRHILLFDRLVSSLSWFPCFLKKLVFYNGPYLYCLVLQSLITAMVGLSSLP
jgi:hypothetical protein